MRKKQNGLDVAAMNGVAAKILNGLDVAAIHGVATLRKFRMDLMLLLYMEWRLYIAAIHGVATLHCFDVAAIHGAATLHGLMELRLLDMELRLFDGL